MGGHRLWIAPETPETSYLPDNAACMVVTNRDWIEVTAPDNGSGVGRSIRVTTTDRGFTIGNTLHNVTERQIGPIAPWAITQFPVNGTAIAPLRAPADAHDLHGAHAVVFWKYSDPTDPRLTIGGDHILVAGTDERAAFKVGLRPGSGTLGYFRNGRLFIKHSPPVSGDAPDLGARTQIYTGAGFLELETLGATAVLQPGDTVDHEEDWLLRAVGSLDEAIEQVGQHS